MKTLIQGTSVSISTMEHLSQDLTKMVLLIRTIHEEEELVDTTDD